MPAQVVWIDNDRAKLFELTHDKMERNEIRRHDPDHHTGRPEDRKDKVPHRFFNEVANRIQGARAVLILGPGQTKLHFKTFLAFHFGDLARAIVGCETVDHPSDAQIADLARKLFKP